MILKIGSWPVLGWTWRVMDNSGSCQKIKCSKFGTLPPRPPLLLFYVVSQMVKVDSRVRGLRVHRTLLKLSEIIIAIRIQTSKQVSKHPFLMLTFQFFNFKFNYSILNSIFQFKKLKNCQSSLSLYCWPALSWPVLWLRSHHQARPTFITD